MIQMDPVAYTAYTFFCFLCVCVCVALFDPDLKPNPFKAKHLK